MHIILVSVRVKPAQIDAFRLVASENAQKSLTEPGLIHFDVLQQSDDPTRFTLYEVYRDDAARDAHRETAHYGEWREAIKSLLAEPLEIVQYEAVHLTAK